MMIKENKTDIGQTIVANIDAAGHVTGRSVYVDDLPVLEGTLFAKIFDSQHAHGIIKSIDFSKAEKMEGVVKIFSAKDIPGQNEIGGIIADEPLMADEKVQFQGQPVLLIIAENEDLAEEAIKEIKIEFDPLPIVTDPREAFRQGQLLSKSRTFKKGDTKTAFE
ncbi:MAG: hypothetical protein ABR503_06935, partial [Chitinophagaceae bacterium]